MFKRRKQQAREAREAEANDRLYRSLRWKEHAAYADELRFAKELKDRHGDSDYHDQLVRDGPDHSLSDRFRIPLLAEDPK